MGMECIKACLKGDSTSIPSVPPASVSPQNKMNNELRAAGEEKFSKCLRQRPWINYSQFDNSSEEDSDSDLLEQDLPVIPCLPKGVIRGCAECINCQKVTAKWQPEEACRPLLNDAPVFYPTEEEFEDTLKYIASIRPKAEFYGICRIVPPISWNPPCPLKGKHVWENSKFSTRIQKIDKLQNRYSARKLSKCHSVRRKRQRLMKKEAELRNMDPISVEPSSHACHNNAERFGFEPGPEFTLESFKTYADYFKEQYFRNKESDKDLSCNRSDLSGQWEPSVEGIEGEYWRIVEKPTEEIEVLYGADLETGSFGSGFPKMSSVSTSSSSEDKYVKSGWNLNNFPRLSGSVLAFESSDISGVLVPWLYVGMCFSSFCWHVEDHHFYSLNYMHWGAPKIWYGIPGRDALKLEMAMKKHLSDLFVEQPDLLHNLVTQFSPSTLKSEGVPVFRCVQNPGEFVLTFPRAYHSGFNCGFNCAEAVNVAPIDWLPHGQFAVELYREQRRKISVSHDKLLLGAAREAVRAQWNVLFLARSTPDYVRWKNACGPDGILAKALRSRIDTERTRREYLCSLAQSRKMDANFDANSEQECDICHYDLHLSAVGCSCSSERFACLEHAKQMCSCTWDRRFFLFRYEIGELNVLLDAVGGKLSAVHRWALSDLGLSLSSYVNKDKMQESDSACKKIEGTKPIEQGSLNQENFAGAEKSYGFLLSTSPASSGKPMVKYNGRADSFAATHTAMDQSVSISNVQGDNEGNRKEAVGTLEKKELCSTDKPPSDMKLEDQPFQVTVGHIELDAISAGQKGCQLSLTDLCSELQQNTREQKSFSHSASVDRSNQAGSSNSMDKARSTEADDGLLIDNDGEKALQFLRKINEEPIDKCPEGFDWMMGCNNKVTPSNCEKDQVLETPQTDASDMDDAHINSATLVENVAKISGPHGEVKDLGKYETCGEVNSLLTNQSLAKASSQSIISSDKPSSLLVNHIEDFLTSNQVGDGNCSNFGTSFQPPQSHGSVNICDGKDGKSGFDSSFKSTLRGQPVTVSPPILPKTVDRHNRQGPRMAKVVRRINSVVEPLAYGVVLSGQFWSCRLAIFPKGFRSRVKYFSVLDPTQMCYYVSEILDAGLLGPLFMVQVEQCPNEVFIHLSATRCWDMVRERVNHEIRKQHSLGKIGVPALQPPVSLDGLEMFGLTSPAIIKVIEAIDVDHVCLEYWKSKPQNKDTPLPEVLVGDSGSNVGHERGPYDKHLLPGADVTFQGLVKKLNSEELHLLCNVLGNERLTFKEDAYKLVNKEIESRPNS
uniref:Putative lysine-specific demethylase JMJ14 n=1 Tax=Anthurium amnicola TaxID=1678845 RepID=A0A1D1Y1R8_9ARAE